MIGFFRRLLKDRRGNALVLGAACLPLIVGAAGLASDTIQWTLWKRQLQRAADSAAIAGVYDRSNNAGGTSTVSTTVTHDLSLNLHTFYSLKSGYPVVTFPSDSGVKIDQVKVTVAIQQKLPFASMFLSTPPTIIANATAASIPAGGDACIEALETASTTGITFTGNAAVYSPDCDIFSNSSGTNVTVGKGSADVTANSVGGVGGVQQSNNFHVTAYRPYSPALADPFSAVAVDTSAMKCATQTVVKGGKNVTTALAADETTDFTAAKAAGINCFTALSVASNKSLTNIPDNFGPIYINGGSVNFQGNFTCNGCTIVLTNSDPSLTATIGNISANASANVNITAPTSGTYTGLAIYQDRRASDCSNCNKINGNSGSIITGAIYFPKQELQYNGTGTTNATCTMFVARRITFSGNSGTSNKFKKLSDCAAAGLPGSSTTRIVRLVA
jgi:Flp pilus assembly protein TadG